jgi:hypothetical protein
LIDEDVEEFDRWLLDNPTIVNNWLLTNINVVYDRLRIEDWEFKWKDSDDIANKKKFWEDVEKSIDLNKSSDPKYVDFVLNKYFSRFGLSSVQDRQQAYQRIKTAYHRNEKKWKKVLYDYNGKWRNNSTWLDMGIIWDKEIEDIIRYTFQWTVRKDCFSARKLPVELENALKKFQNLFSLAFKNKTLDDKSLKSSAFKSENYDPQIMYLWSNKYYKEVLSWDENSFEIDDWTWDDDFTNDKQRKKAQKRAFQNWWFINHKMAQIEKSFKNRLPSGSYHPITQDTSFDIEKKIKLL